MRFYRSSVFLEGVIVVLGVGVMAFRLAHDRGGPGKESLSVRASGDELRRDAEEAFREKNFALAATLYANLLRVEPEDIPARLRLAEVFHRNAWNESALALLEEVFQRDPNNTPARLLRAKIRRDEGESDLAVEDYERVLAVDPNNAEASYYLGTTYHAAKRIDDAIRAYRRAVESDPHLEKPFFESVPFGIQARVMLGRTYRQQAAELLDVGNRPESLRRLEEALDVLREATALSKSRRIEAEETDEENPGYEALTELVSALRQKASLLRRMGDPNGPEVLAVFEEIARVDPENTDALVEIGSIRYRTARSREDLKAAEKFLQRAFELDPLDLDAQVTLKAVRDDLALSDADLARALQ